MFLLMALGPEDISKIRVGKLSPYRYFFFCFLYFYFYSCLLTKFTFCKSSVSNFFGIWKNSLVWHLK
jgi:hypothetical protein